MVKEDVNIATAANAFWLTLQSSAWSDIKGLAYLDGATYSDSYWGQEPAAKQSKVQRLGNTNCSPLIYYKNPSVIYPPSPHPRDDIALPALTIFGGIVSGLPNGQSLTLARNYSNQSFEVSANGYFQFILSTYVIRGYSITISSMPSGYNCIFNNGTRTVDTTNPDLGNISIVCSAPYTYNVSGTLSGLDAGQTITLSNNDNDPITLSANGAFNFTKPIPAGTIYSVSIQQEPDYKLCKVSQGSGTSQSNVSNININCRSLIIETLAIGDSNKWPAPYPFYNVVGLAVDSVGNVFFNDQLAAVVRKLSPDGTVSTFAGSTDLRLPYGGLPIDGPRESVGFYYLRDLTLDVNGNIFVADDVNVRKIDTNGNVTLYAGGAFAGMGDGNAFWNLLAITIDKNDNLYVTDGSNIRLKKITPTREVTTLAGTRDYSTSNPCSPVFCSPKGVAVDAAGNVYVADSGYNKIRKITPSGTFSTLAGNGESSSINGKGSSVSFDYPTSVAVDTNGFIYVADYSGIRKINPSGYVSTLTNINANKLAVDSKGDIYYSNGAKIQKISMQ
jgi:hypothetical protein